MFITYMSLSFQKCKTLTSYIEENWVGDSRQAVLFYVFLYDLIIF